MWLKLWGFRWLRRCVISPFAPAAARAGHPRSAASSPFAWAAGEGGGFSHQPVPKEGRWWTNMLPMKDLVHMASAEFLAMFIFIFICVGCAISTTGVAEGAATGAPDATLAISLCFGLTIFVLVHCFGHISGAHINPAVTLALLLSCQVEIERACCYVVAQFLGSILASAAVMVVMGLEPDTMSGYNLLSGSNENRVARGFVTELILTMLLVFAVLGSVDPARAKTGMAPVAIGLAVGVAHLVAVPITGCGINPARSLGPVVVSGNQEAWEDVWVFLMAPLVGATVATLLYVFWFAEGKFEGGLRSSLHIPEQSLELDSTPVVPVPAPDTPSSQASRPGITTVVAATGNR